VANGFPTDLMTKEDAIVSTDLLQIFDLKVGEQILLKFEFLSFLPQRYDNIQSIIFEEELPTNAKNLTRG